MDISGICPGVAIVVIVIMAILILIRAFDLFGVDERETLANQEVRKALRANKTIFRESLVKMVEERLFKIKPKMIDWRYDINNAVNKLIEEGWVKERQGVLYASLPPDG